MTSGDFEAADQSRELTLNQLWETLSTVAKAGFFFLTTPLLISRLGQDGYGLFALALSIMACVFGFDFGLRLRLRVRLSAALEGSDVHTRAQIFARFLGELVLLELLFVAIAFVTARVGVWSQWFKVDAGALSVLVISLSGLYVLSQQLLEPLAARGRLSQVKAAAFAGQMAALVAVAAAAWCGGSVATCAVSYVLALTVPNLALALWQPSPELVALPHTLAALAPRNFLASLLDGGWYALLAVEWLLKSYLLTFLVAGLFGPGEAGAYFILLKLSELVSVFGANASDTSTADLAARPSAAARRESLRGSYAYSLAMSLVAFAGLACLGPKVLELWFGLSAHSAGLAVLVGGFGLASAFQRILLTASMGVGLTGSAALWGMVETALVWSGAVFLQEYFGLSGIFLAGTLAGAAWLVPARRIARLLESTTWCVWGRPAMLFVTGLIASTTCAIIADRINSWVLAIVGLVLGVGAAALSLRRGLAR